MGTDEVLLNSHEQHLERLLHQSPLLSNKDSMLDGVFEAHGARHVDGEILKEAVALGDSIQAHEAQYDEPIRLFDQDEGQKKGFVFDVLKFSFQEPERTFEATMPG